MVDVLPTNEKLVVRSQRIIQQATGCDAATAAKAFEAADQHVKLAIVMILTQRSGTDAQKLLTQTNGFIGQTVTASSEEKNRWHKISIKRWAMVATPTSADRKTGQIDPLYDTRSG